MSFYTSLSGLRGAQTDLGTTANNIANVGSVGFKRSRASFGDIKPASSTTAGQGTRLKGIDQQFTQGGFETSARELDLAISGSGFFVTRSDLTGGSTYFTRNGSVAVDAQRYLVDSNGAYVQVLPVDDEGAVTASSLAAARALQLPERSGTPRATSLVNLAVTLPGSADKPADRGMYSATTPWAFDRLDPNSYNYSQQTTVYDSEGSPIPATLYFVRTGATADGDPADTWEVHTFLGNEDATGTPITLTFDATGAITSPTGPQALAAVQPTGASAPLAVSLDFGTATAQTTGAFDIASLAQDGVGAAKLNDLSVSETGLVTATFADGTTQALGAIVLANFANPTGLRQQGDARWTVTGDSGPAIIGTAGGEGFGRIQSGTLERANVDITEELVALISAQRNFQANAKAIETANAMTQSIMNLRQ